MRRGTPSAELFGGLLFIVRTAGAGRSMRQVGDELGAPPATVSQVEKGERALKEPKISAWAGALGVSGDDLHELWTLSQGQVPAGPERLVFYDQHPAVLGRQPLRSAIVNTLKDRPDLEPIYRLTERIATVLQRLLPRAEFQVEPDDFEPPYIDEMYAGTITSTQERENELAAATFDPLPLIWCYWGSGSGRPQDGKRDAVRVPLLRELAPIVRRRGKTVEALELEDLIRDLSGPERERVRGYIEAIVEQRAASLAEQN